MIDDAVTVNADEWATGIYCLSSTIVVTSHRILFIIIKYKLNMKQYIIFRAVKVNVISR